MDDLVQRLRNMARGGRHLPDASVALKAAVTIATLTAALEGLVNAVDGCGRPDCACDDCVSEAQETAVVAARAALREVGR